MSVAQEDELKCLFCLFLQLPVLYSKPPFFALHYY
jgi:hypothetical protein